MREDPWSLVQTITTLLSVPNNVLAENSVRRRNSTLYKKPLPFVVSIFLFIKIQHHVYKKIYIMHPRHDVRQLHREWCRYYGLYDVRNKINEIFKYNCIRSFGIQIK